MPIFEYRCARCGKVFEVLQLAGASGEEQTRCPDCGGSDLKKLISAPFIPSSVGRSANEERTASCCGEDFDYDECMSGECTPGSCCGWGGELH